MDKPANVTPPQTQLTIAARFRGPPESGNGGYVSGAVAEMLIEREQLSLDTAIEVTLRAPIPLDKSMDTSLSETGVFRVHDAGTLIAEATATELVLEVPDAPTFSQALAARPQSASFHKNINPLIPEGRGFHPICFCCGADLAPDEGLHVYAAAGEDYVGVAAAWRPADTFADAAGYLPAAVIWAALDCPGQFAYLASGIRTGMLGRMTARLLKPVLAQQNFVITGWCIEVERSKHFAGTAIFDEAGELCGFSKQVWIGRMD
jgi:acyl-coenzyme A thioesterase PaaI-like protein